MKKSIRILFLTVVNTLSAQVNDDSAKAKLKEGVFN